MLLKKYQGRWTKRSPEFPKVRPKSVAICTSCLTTNITPSLISFCTYWEVSNYSCKFWQAREHVLWGKLTLDMFNIRTVAMSLVSLWHKSDSNAKYIIITSGCSSAGADPRLLPDLMKLLTSGTTGIHNTLAAQICRIASVTLNTAFLKRPQSWERKGPCHWMEPLRSVCSGPWFLNLRREIKVILKTSKQCSSSYGYLHKS